MELVAGKGERRRVSVNGGRIIKEKLVIALSRKRVKINLLSKLQRPDLGGGVGFEPTTFRL